MKPGKKAKPGTKISFGDGLLMGEVLDVVDEGNRLIKFTYDGIFEEILDQLGQMPCRLTLPISSRTRTGIRPSMRSMTALRQPPQRVCILRRSCCARSRKRA